MKILNCTMCLSCLCLRLGSCLVFAVALGCLSMNASASGNARVVAASVLLEAGLGPSELATLDCTGPEVTLILERIESSVDARQALAENAAAISQMTRALVSIGNGQDTLSDPQQLRLEVEAELEQLRSARATLTSAMLAHVLDEVCDPDRAAMISAVGLRSAVSAPWRFGVTSSDEAVSLSSALKTRDLAQARGEPVPTWASDTISSALSSPDVADALAAYGSRIDEVKTAFQGWLIGL